MLVTQTSVVLEREPPSREEALIILTRAVLVMPQLSLSIQNPLPMPEEALLVHNWVLITQHYDT